MCTPVRVCVWAGAGCRREGVAIWASPRAGWRGPRRRTRRGWSSALAAFLLFHLDFLTAADHLFVHLLWRHHFHLHFMFPVMFLIPASSSSVHSSQAPPRLPRPALPTAARPRRIPAAPRARSSSRDSLVRRRYASGAQPRVARGPCARPLPRRVPGSSSARATLPCPQMPWEEM